MLEVAPNLNGSQSNALQIYLKQLNWSISGFARRVHQRCQVIGLSNTVSPSTVSRWCRGKTVPGPELCAAACHVLSSALHQIVTPESLGWSAASEDIAAESLEYSGLAHAVRILGKLWELDFLCKHNNIQRMFFAVTFDSASREALVMPPDLDLSGHGHRKVSTADVELLKHHTHLYGKLDALHGSGKFRSVFAGFMDAHTTELLHGSFSTQLGRKLYGSVADAVLTMASMAYDDQLPGLAQRYDLQAMRLAQAIGDRSRITRAHIHHARLAAAHGERKCALTHARSAVLASAGAPPLVKAYAAVTEARAWAFNGQPSQTSAAVARARDALNRAGSTDPGWLSWLDRSELERQAAWALAVAGLSVPGMDALHEALNVPSDHRRANVELLITAAELARLRGDLAEHASLAKRAEDASRPLMSRRLAARVKLLVSGQPLDDF